jgi:hypothetical protein
MISEYNGSPPAGERMKEKDYGVERKREKEADQTEQQE